MAIQREQIGPAQNYKGRVITAHALSIDVLMRIDGNDAGQYTNKEAGFTGAMNNIDEQDRRK